MMLIVNNFNELKTVENNRSTYLSYQTALLTSAFIANSFNGKQNPSFEELFPNCISEEEKRQREKNELLLYKEKFKAYMVLHNKGGK